jgi:hypothetical protein
MKKVIAIFAIATLVACGGASTEVKTDSTAVAVDSTAVVTTDSTAVVTEPTESGAAAPAAGIEAIK